MGRTERYREPGWSRRRTASDRYESRRGQHVELRRRSRGSGLGRRADIQDIHWRTGRHDCVFLTGSGGFRGRKNWRYGKLGWIVVDRYELETCELEVSLLGPGLRQLCLGYLELRMQKMRGVRRGLPVAKRVLLMKLKIEAGCIDRREAGLVARRLCYRFQVRQR